MKLLFKTSCQKLRVIHDTNRYKYNRFSTYKKWFSNVTRRIFHELKKEKKHIEYAKYYTFAYVFLIWLHFGAVFTTGSQLLCRTPVVFPTLISAGFIDSRAIGYAPNFFFMYIFYYYILSVTIKESALTDSSIRAHLELKMKTLHKVILFNYRKGILTESNNC